MYHLRLIKGLSYLGSLSATKKEPDVFTEDEAAVEEATASGYFELIGGVVSDGAAELETEPETEPEENPDLEALAAMSKAELTAFAEEHEIDLAGCRTKADIFEAISAFYGGSYTMIDLQRE